MRTIGAAKFKASCLSLLDEVEGEGIVITKHGRPVARLVPIQQAPGSLIGALKGRLEVHGDITPTGVPWDAESRHGRPRVPARR